MDIAICAVPVQHAEHACHSAKVASNFNHHITEYSRTGLEHRGSMRQSPLPIELRKTHRAHRLDRPARALRNTTLATNGQWASFCPRPPTIATIRDLRLCSPF
ncbi:hypothetical protein MN608_03652 [Microdochium nivale]|nr:hypothetical protein MN608_03652 [Microdochium nivale]